MSDKKYVVVEAEWVEKVKKLLSCADLEGCSKCQSLYCDIAQNGIKFPNAKPLTPEQQMAGEMKEAITALNESASDMLMAVLHDKPLCSFSTEVANLHNASIRARRFCKSSTLGGSHEA